MNGSENFKMKDKRKFKEIMEGLGEVFDKDISKKLLGIYWEALGKYSDEEAELAIKKSEAKYRTLAEQSIQGLTVVTDEGFLYVNNAFAEMVGRTIEDILKLKGEEVWSLLHPEDRIVLRERITAMKHKKVDSVNI